MRILYTLLGFFFFVQADAQLQQHIIRGSNSNVIYQSFDAGEGGELQSIKISTDQTGLVYIKLYEDDKTYSSEDPIWEINNVVKSHSGELVVDLSGGHGVSRVLAPNRKYCFSVYGAGNIHHSFLDDVYPGGNYRFEDGIERKGDLFFELELSPTAQRFSENVAASFFNTQEQIVVFPNPTYSEIQISGIENNTEVAIFDNTGKTVLKKKIQSAEKLRLDNLLPGAYYLRINIAGRVYTKKIIKSDK